MNISFGKIPVFKCTVNKYDNSKKSSATLYELETDNAEDLAVVENNLIANALYKDFLNPMANTGTKFYLLQDDETKDVIAAAETSHHYKKEYGTYTLIDEFEGNHNYVDPAEPMLAQIANEANYRFDENITVASNTDEKAGLANAKFTKKANGVMTLRHNKFESLIDRTEKKYNIDYSI